jgi:hypothetical protein
MKLKMRPLFLMAIAAVFFSVLAAVAAGKFETTASAPSHSKLLNSTRAIQLVNSGCGLCSDTDCCGGASLGWKLCQSDCPAGKKKCMLVDECP